ncbi:MAG: sulfotransferase [Halioglobus sp.]
MANAQNSVKQSARKSSVGRAINSTAPVYTFRDAQLRSPLLKTVNALGAGLGALGKNLPALGAPKIVAAAQARAASSREPDTETNDALERFIASAETEANLNTFGRLAVKNMLAGSLASRFAVQDWHAQNPLLAEQQVKQPWIIVGLPRTGTSILSILLGLDPLSRPILQWEARHPIPPAGIAEASEDPRITALSSEMAKLKKLNPAIATMHPFGSTLAEECTAIFTYSLRTIGMETIAYTPSYGNWLDSADMAPAYDIHRQTLQALQAVQPAGHWVLKSPNHLWCLPALLQAYPDARIIWTHRDPSQVLPSLASLNCAMQMQFTRQLDPVKVGNYWAEKLETAIEAATEFDESNSREWCMHVQYEDLVADPLATLGSIYSRFGASIGDLHQQRVSTWLQQKPQHADGKHAYNPADFGWTKQSLQERFRTYRNHYVETC